MSDDHRTNCCPYCESSSISHSKERESDTPDRALFCGDCRRYFDEPDRRFRWNGNSQLTRKLIKMDPDEVPSRGSP